MRILEVGPRRGWSEAGVDKNAGLDESLVFGRFGSRGRLPVVPGRLVQTGTELGIRLPRRQKVSRPHLHPSRLVPTRFVRCLPSGTHCARPFRCASSQRDFRADCSLIRRGFGELFRALGGGFVSVEESSYGTVPNYSWYSAIIFCDETSCHIVYSS